MKTKQLIFLGTGTSQGVPIIGCSCKVCTSKDSRDRRLRTSALLKMNGQHLLFDTSADFRQQMLENNITQIDAVLFTHEHRDHTAGLDELRPLTWKTEKALPIYAEARVLEYLKLAFPYIMGKDKYPGGAKIKPLQINETPFEVEQIGTIIPIRVSHFQELPILGFRIDNFAYITDCKKIDDNNLQKLYGIQVLVINALGKKTHPSHICLDEAIDIIQKVHPQQAYLTHIGHNMGLYQQVTQELPPNIHLAYDGLTIDF